MPHPHHPPPAVLAFYEGLGEFKKLMPHIKVVGEAPLVPLSSWRLYAPGSCFSHVHSPRRSLLTQG